MNKNIFCIVLIFTLICMSWRIESLSKKIKSLDVNQNLILLQLQESENEIKRVEKEVDQIDHFIDKYSKQFGLDKNLVHAIAIVESGKNQQSISASNAVGVMQVLPSTAKAMGENPYTIEGNIKASIKYLSYLHKKFNGDEDLILAGYNAGPNAVVKHGGMPPYKETKNYVKKVKTVKAKLDNENR